MDQIIVKQLFQMSSRVIADAGFSFPYYAAVSGRSFCLSPLHTDVLFSLITSDKIPIIRAFSDKLPRAKGLCWVSGEELLKSVAIRLWWLRH